MWLMQLIIYFLMKNEPWLNYHNHIVLILFVVNHSNHAFITLTRVYVTVIFVVKLDGDQYMLYFRGGYAHDVTAE